VTMVLGRRYNSRLGLYTVLKYCRNTKNKNKLSALHAQSLWPNTRDCICVSFIQSKLAAAYLENLQELNIYETIQPIQCTAGTDIMQLN
jgi:hypothetical protein